MSTSAYDDTVNPTSKSVQSEIFTNSGELIVGGGGAALSTRVRPLEDRHPFLAFIERRADDDLEDRAGVTLPPVGGRPTAGPTSGQWGSG